MGQPALIFATSLCFISLLLLIVFILNVIVFNINRPVKNGRLSYLHTASNLVILILLVSYILGFTAYYKEGDLFISNVFQFHENYLWLFLVVTIFFYIFLGAFYRKLKKKVKAEDSELGEQESEGEANLLKKVSFYSRMGVLIFDVALIGYFYYLLIQF